MQFKCSITREAFTVSQLLIDKADKEVMPRLSTLEVTPVEVENGENYASYVHMLWQRVIGVVLVQ